jgi:hydrogenase maturation protease
VADLVVGIGNLIMGDDGVGVRVVQQLADSRCLPAGVRLLDGGTLGLDLLYHLEGVERLLFVDAVDWGAAPGSLIRMEGEEIPELFATRLSPHQVGLQDLLAVADLQGMTFAEMVLWGIQPASIGLGLDLSPAVAEGFPTLVAKVVDEVSGWGTAGGQ